MRLTVAANYDHRIVSQLRKYPVSEVYGKFPVDFVGGGRPSYMGTPLSAADLRQYVLLLGRHGIAFNYLLNSSCMGNREWTRGFQTKITSLLGRLEEWGIGWLTVSTPFLLELIKTRFPKFRVKVGIYAQVDTAKRAKFWEDLGADAINLESFSINRDFGRLAAIRRAVRCDLQLIANHPCLPNCPIGPSTSTRPFAKSRCGSTRTWNRPWRAGRCGGGECHFLTQPSKESRIFARMRAAVPQRGWPGPWRTSSVLKYRSCEPELLDQPDLDPGLARQSYAFMAFVNQVCGGVRTVRRFVAREASRVPAGRPLRVLDIGSGTCDIPIAVVRWAGRHGIDVRFTCLDINAYAPAIARGRIERAGLGERVRLVEEDVFTHQPTEAYDCAVGSMFFHHLTDEQILSLVGHLRTFVRRSVLVSDPGRNWPDYIGGWLLTLPLSRNKSLVLGATVL